MSETDPLRTSQPDRMLDPRVQADLLLYRLYRVHITASRLVVSLFESEYGLTRREWLVLSCLSEREGVLSSELAEHAMLDRVRTSRALTRLAGKKLISRQPKPSDRREVHVFLTEAGRRVYETVFPRVVAINRELASVLSPAERSLFDRMVDTLQARVHEMVATSNDALPPVDSDE